MLLATLTGYDGSIVMDSIAISVAAHVIENQEPHQSPVPTGETATESLDLELALLLLSDPRSGRPEK